jgi:hypothetical protein
MEYVSNFEGVGFKPCFHTFFINYLRPMGVEVAAHVVEGQGWWAHVEEAWGGGLTWCRAAGRGGADHHADWTKSVPQSII